ncbi:MAG: cupin domain-containing protein [Ideonella sp.]|nr:cupin domain-containing protein [Ideonella sp.]
MAESHLVSGQVVSVAPLGERLGSARTTALLKAAQLEVVRVVLPAGKSMREHAVPGEITLQCLEGEVEFSTPAGRLVLSPGDFLHLAGGVPHGLVARTDASLLLTICLAAPPR